jgi:hypothetical protein
VSFYVSVGMLYDHLKDGNMRRMYKVERIPCVLLKVMKIFDLLLKKVVIFSMALLQNLTPLPTTVTVRPNVH